LILRFFEMEQHALQIKGRKKRTPGYGSWRGMLDRCSNPKHESFRYYGAKGVTVCDRWRSFENFIADMGPRPSPRHSLERPHGGDYTPGRVIWGTWEDQVETRAPADRIALSRAGRKSASIKRARKRAEVEHAGQLALFSPMPSAS
jgi:hypothetical protein